MALDISQFQPSALAQVLYIGYFQRAGEPEGIDFWANFLQNEENGDNLQARLANAADRFADSDEAETDFPFLTATDPSQDDIDGFVTSVFQNLFNRDPEQEGLEFYRGLVEDEIAKDVPKFSNIILDILNGAQNEDLTTVENKINASDAFTQALIDNELEYNEAAGEEVVDTVTDETSDPAATGRQIAETSNDPRVSVSSNGPVEEGSTLEFTVDLANADGFDDQGRVTESTIQIAKSGSNIQDGETISVDIGGETVTATFSGDQDASGIAQALVNEIDGLDNVQSVNADSNTITIRSTSDGDVEPTNFTDNTSANVSANLTVTDEEGAGTRSVDYAVSFAGGATSADHGQPTLDGNDVPLSGTLTFADGETSKTISIPIETDTQTPESGEGITLTLSNAGGNITISGDGSETADITDVAPQDGDTFNLTQGADSPVGTDGNDLFVAGVEATAATTKTTLDSQDILDGGAGIDTLRVFATTGDTAITAAPEITGVEEIEIRASDNSTLDLTGANITGLETVSIRGNADNTVGVTVDDGVAIDLDNAGTGAITVTFNDSNSATQEISASSAGEADTAGTLNVANTDDITTLSFVDITGENNFATAVTSNPNNVETLSFNGSGSMDAGAFTGTGVTSVNASGLAGGLTIDISAATGQDRTFTGGSGDDNVTAVAADDLTVAAGAGADTIDISGSTGALNATDDIDGGDGIDTLAIDEGDLAAVTSDAVSNVENLSLAAGAITAATIDFDDLLSGLTQLTIATGASNSIAIDNADGKTVNVEAALGEAGATTPNNLTINDDTASDEVTVNVSSEDSAITNANTASAVALAGIETATINITAGTNALTLGAVSTTGADTVNLSITEGDLDGGTAGAVTLASVTADNGDVDITVDVDGVSVAGAIDLTGADSVDFTVNGDTFDAATLTSDASDVDITLNGDDNDIAAATLSGVTALDITSAGTSNSIVDLNAASLTDLTIDVNSGDFTTTNNAANTALETVDVNGSGDIDITFDAAQTNLTTVDLSDYTGELADGAIDLSATTVGVTVEVGAVDGQDPVGTGNAAGTGDILLGAGNAVRDDVVFNSDFSGSVAIENFESGGDVVDDNIDLSAFDIAGGTADLNVAADGDGGDTVITSANDDFEFEIVLTGVTPGSVNANDFIF